MIKQEIEQAIENGETVYYYLYGKYHEEKLNRSYFIQEFCDNDCLFKAYCDFDDDAKEEYILPLNQIYKTKAEAEEYLEFGNVTRTDTLKMPSFKDFTEDTRCDFYNQCNSYTLICLGGNVTIYHNNFTDSAGTFQRNIFDKPLTKENYDEARRLCIKLFKGESV